MDPVTGAGLAASVITLANLCLRGCKTIYLLQSSLKEVPREISNLADEVDTLRTLLIEIHHFTQDAGDIAISPGLQSIWQRSEASLQKDLKTFESIVRKIQDGLDNSASHKRILAHIRHAISDEKIAKYRLAFRAHIDNLNLVHNLLARQQLTSMRASMNIIASNLNGRIRESPKDIANELQAIHNNLSALSGSMGQDGGAMTSQLNLLKDYIVAMQWKKFFWKWSLYQLPIGILSIEAALAESDPVDSLQTASRKRKRAQVVFKFKPPAWFMKCVLEVAFTIHAQGTQLPYWQRSTCGRLSLLPADLSTYLGESDYLATGDCLLRVPFGDVLQLCKQEQLSGALVPCYGGTFGEKGNYEPFVGKGFVVTLDNRIASLRERSSPSIIVPYKTFGDVNQSRSRKSFAHQWAAFRRDYLYFSSIYKETEIPCIAQHLPRIGIPVSSDGFQDFVHYIGQHLDPQNILEFSRVDFWWMSALLYDNSRFKAFISNHLATFSSYSHQSEVSRTLASFDYQNIVHQILSDSRSAQVGFVSFLCAFGTANMLIPFIAQGFDWNTDERQNLFLRGSVLLGNLNTFKFLLELFDGSKTLVETINDDILHEYLSNPFPSSDDGFLGELLKQISLLHPPERISPSSMFGIGYESHPAIQQILSERPYRVATRREVFYICGVFFSQNGYNFANGVKFGLDDALQMMLHHQDSKKASVVELQEALTQSEKYLFSRHPRKATIVKAEEEHNETLLIDTVYFVDEGSDVLCCWLLANALKTLGAFSEEKYAPLVRKVTETVGTMEEIAIDEFRQRLAQYQPTADFNDMEGTGKNISMQEQEIEKSDLLEAITPGSHDQPSDLCVPPYEPSPSSGIYDESQYRTKMVLNTINKTVGPLMDCMELYSRQLLSLTSFDLLLLVVGIPIILTATVQYVLWELLMWLSTVQQVSKSTVALVGACAMMYVWKR